MKLNLIYWIIIGILGFGHLYLFSSHVPIFIPIYVLIFFISCFVMFCYKKFALTFWNLGYKFNFPFFILQFLLLFFYIDPLTLAGHLVILSLFMGIEWLRFVLGLRISTVKSDLQQIQEQYLQLNETFSIVRKERHDFLKHISSVHFMVENNNITEARTYLEEMVGGYKQTNLSIKGERGAVAGVLHSMYKRAQASDIEMVYDFDLPLSTLPLSDKEIVALIGNLLSNSLDASIDWKRKHHIHTQITLQFYKRSGLFLLQCKNSTLPVPNEVLDGLYQSYGKSTKGEGHEGLGTKIIHDIIKENLGFLDFTCKEGEFTVKIKIPAIR